MRGGPLKCGIIYAAAVCSILAYASASAFAQTVAGSEGVMDRPRPDYDAKGLPLGGFRLFPKIDVNVGSDDNVLRAATGAKQSMVTQEIPSFLLRSEWSRHELDFYGNLAASQYNDLSGEDSTDWIIGGDGRLDIQRGSDFSGGASHAHQHEPRNSPDLPSFASEPTQYDLTHANGAFSYSPYSFGFRAGMTFDRYDYQATPVFGTGAAISNADRNRNEYDAFARASYGFSPGYAVFVQGDYIGQDFDSAVDRNLLHRTNFGYRGDVGLSLELSRLVQGELYIGYLDQNFKAPLKDVSGLNFGAAINWFPTDVLTVHLRASRTLIATTIAGASTNDNKLFGISADYELLPNVILQGAFNHTDSTFKGLPRHDQIDNFSVGATYLLNRDLSANARFAHETRNSNAAGANYDDNLIMGGLTLHL